MRLSSFGRIFVFIFSFVILLSISTARAQTLNNTSGTATRAAVGTTTQADFSSSIDPMSVSSFSDDQLNETFNKMAAGYSKNAVLFNNIGATFYKRQMYDKAELAVRHAIAINYHPAFLTNLSIIYDVQERYPEAISAAERAVNQSPRYARARNQLCELLMVTKRDAESVQCYDELAKLTTLDAAAETYYSIALMRDGNADKVISILSPLVQAPNPTVLMYNTLGYAYYMKKRYPQAASTFKQAVELDPDNASVRYNLAIVLTTENDRAGALAQYNLIKRTATPLADQLYRDLNRDKIIYVNEATAAKK